MDSNAAASHCAAGPPYTEAPQILDMAVCHHPASLLYLDDHATDTWGVSQLVELDIHHHSQHFSFTGLVFSGSFLPRVCKGTAAPQPTRKVHVRQGDCLLLLLAGKVSEPVDSFQLNRKGRKKVKKKKEGKKSIQQNPRESCEGHKELEEPKSNNKKSTMLKKLKHLAQSQGWA